MVTFGYLIRRSGVWSSSIRDCVFDTMTHENTWRDGIRYFMTTNLNACATLQNKARDYQNIEILCWMFFDEHKPPYFRTPHCFKHKSVPICWFLHLAVIYKNFGSRLKSRKSLDGQSEIFFSLITAVNLDERKAYILNPYCHLGYTLLNILIVTRFVLESSTSVQVCRHEIPNTVASCVFVGHRVKHTVSAAVRFGDWGPCPICLMWCW